MSAHTPGRWIVDVNNGLIHATDDRHTIVCHFAASLRHPDVIADARLIAAAPELLAIAERLALATDECDDKAQGTHYVAKDGAIRCKGSFLALIADARAAIAKATGSAT